MSTYKLIYFNAKGRAENARLIFAQAGVKYEDVRLEKEEWAKLKPDTPTGMLPLLEVDGKQISGSGPISRFLAKRFDLAGKDDIEAAQLDGISDVVTDFMVSFSRLFGVNDEAKKAELVKEITEKDLPKYWGIIEKRLGSSTSGWIYGDNVSYVDLGIYNVLDYILQHFTDFPEKFPNVVKLRAKVEALLNIAEWLKNRPKTNF